MVGTDLPQGIETTHAVITNQCVHQRVLEGMSHVQGAGDIRRRQHDGVGLALAGRLETAGAFPMLIPLGFKAAGFKTFFHEGSAEVRCQLQTSKM